MHGRTFAVLKAGTVVTIWGTGKHRGTCGTVTGKDGRNVFVRLSCGDTAQEDYRQVACGDNSQFKDE